MTNNNSFVRRLCLLLVVVCTSLMASAQTAVKGNVTDEKGEPIIGASIQIKGEQGGAVTDLNGNYKINNVGNNAVLVFSYVGYSTQNVPVGGRSTINVKMKEDRELLDEVVVVGYAVGTKRTISGAVDRVGKEDMNKGIITSAADALKGKVAGVVISQSGGDPMGTTNIRVRGTSSLSGGNDPLVIIDGVFSDMTMFSALAPGDIESMTILKDASETAQYGSRGAAGVIVVTTTKGKTGVTSLNYNGQFGINTVFKNIEM